MVPDLYAVPRFSAIRFVFRTLCLLALLGIGSNGFSQEGKQQSSGRREGIDLITAGPDTSLISRYWQQARDCQQVFPDSAIRLLQMARDRSEQMFYPYGIARSLAHAGTIYAHIGNYEKSIYLLKTSISYALRSAQSSLLLPIIYKDLGGIYVLKGDYEKSALYLYQAALLAEKSASIPVRGTIFNNLAVTLLILDSSMQSFPGKSALQYLELAEQYARMSGNQTLITTAVLNKGAYYLKQGIWKEAGIYLQRALQMSRQHHYVEKEHNSLLLLGQLAQEEGKYMEALVWLQQAEGIKGTVNPYYRIMNLALLGETYFETGQLEQALYYLNSAESRARNLGLNYNLMDVHFKLYRLFKQKGQPDAALQYYEAYIRTRDSMTKGESMRHMQQLEVKYHTVQKDKDLLQKRVTIVQQREQLKRKNLWIYIAAGCAVLLGLLFVAAYFVFRSRQRLQRERLQNLEQAYEIGQLKATITGEERERSRLARELHNGIGGLLTAARINYMVLGQQDRQLKENPDYQNVLQMLETISREVRKASHNLMPEILQQNGLTEAIRIYCDQLQKEGEPAIDLQAYGPLEQLQPDFALILYRVVQELVQNVVKHAEARQLLVHLMLQDGLLSLTVEDDGKGFPLQQNQQGMGLHTLRSLVQNMKGTFSVVSEPDHGTSIYVELPLEQHNSVKSI